MHTVIRHTVTNTGFAIVVSGKGSEPTHLQEYDTSPTENDFYTTLIADYPYEDEREAIAAFERLYKEEEEDDRDYDKNPYDAAMEDPESQR